MVVFDIFAPEIITTTILAYKNTQMKKLILISLFAATTALVLGFSSCKKEEDNNALVGTTWGFSLEPLGGDPGWSESYTFLTNTTGSIYYEDTRGDQETYGFTYTYDHPKVTITANEESMVYTIEGDTMVPEDDSERTLYKQ